MGAGRYGVRLGLHDGVTPPFNGTKLFQPTTDPKPATQPYTREGQTVRLNAPLDHVQSHKLCHSRSLTHRRRFREDRLQSRVYVIEGLAGCHCAARFNEAAGPVYYDSTG